MSTQIAFMGFSSRAPNVQPATQKVSTRESRAEFVEVDVLVRLGTMAPKLGLTQVLFPLEFLAAALVFYVFPQEIDELLRNTVIGRCFRRLTSQFGAHKYIYNL